MSDLREPLNFVDTQMVRVLPTEAVFEGSITSEVAQNLLLEGRFIGSLTLQANSCVVIDAGAHVEAQAFRVHTVIVRGHFSGNLDAQMVELAPTARVQGSIRYSGDLVIQAGARVRAAIEGPDEG